MQTGLPGIPVMGMSGMDKLKMILLWTGWVLVITAAVLLVVVWIKSKTMLDLANQNYLRADVVRNKVLGIAKLEVAEYAKVAGLDWE